MSNNMGSLDRILRIVVAVVLIVFAVTGTITGTWVWVAYGVAAVFILTSLVGFCPAYLPLGINTCGKR
ncbi:DUF2892 domain-containing protein [Aurantiacibacter sp. MUD11]|uniref:YgaP family membrane protein n=1 Tax=Aurantiacibacter sp. MUD11 TaxID=3003265 RepID=UPI0022AAF1E6|nr:DUF2892 domain-containing protein [Aurantiacibacter sp. MUD11]WAT16693.1 DUF2892 domain-containing protein [Aurantiacibacter sp. MUD11]